MDSFEYSQAMKEIEYFVWHEFADHYIEMAKAMLYNNQNTDSTRYTLYTIGLGIIKLFAPFLPHITEEIYQNMYKEIEVDKSIHISSWPTEILYDKEALEEGEIVKNFIAKIRSYKSEQGIALNAPLNIKKTYVPKEDINTLKENNALIKATLKLPDNHEFIEGKPDIVEKITSIQPVPAKIGPKFKKQSQEIIGWIKQHQQELTDIIQQKGDITWQDIPITLTVKDEEKLIENNYIKIEKTPEVKEGKVVHIEPFYLIT